MSCLLCLAVWASTTVVTPAQQLNSEQLIEAIKRVEDAAPQSDSPLVWLRYREALLPLYERYSTSLRQELSDLKKLKLSLGGDADANTHKQLDGDLERLTAEIATVETKARSLRGQTQTGATESRPSTPCDCIDELKDRKPYGIIWCEKAGEVEHQLSLQELAERAAPILWFSPNEPLRNFGKFDAQLPTLLPGDDASGIPLVYYRVSRLKLYPSSGISEGEANPYEYLQPANPLDRHKVIDLRKVEELTLKYYFYYPVDRDLNGHRHDLESLRLDMKITARDSEKKKVEDPLAPRAEAVDRYEIRISTILGAAHGVSWYDNQLDIEDVRDTSLPITVFVEEGKHATAPDRNADGFYSPGYDVNRRYEDAWGVRDLLGAGQLGPVKYEGAMTKPREPKDMIVVKATAEATERCLLRPYRGKHRAELDKVMDPKLPHSQRRYTLRHIDSAIYNRVVKGLARDAYKRTKDRNNDEEYPESEKTDKFILDLLEREGFNEPKPRHTHGTGSLEKAAKFSLGIERGEDVFDALTLGLRYDGQWGFTISPPVGRYPVKYLGGYFLPRVNVMLSGRDKRYSLEGLYTPSAARAFDWYVAAGPEWLRPEPGLDYETKFVSEGGVRFRFNKKQLIGFRLGLRATGLKNPRDPRLVFEVGTGAF